MPKLFVENAIEINAPASKVWKVLTDPQLTKEWIQTRWPDLAILESDWKPGSPMLWKLHGGIVGAQGKVTAVEPHKSMSFGFKANDPNSSKEETFTYQLEEREERRNSRSR